MSGRGRGWLCCAEPKCGRRILRNALARCQRSGTLILGPATGPVASVAKLNALAMLRNRHDKGELAELGRRVKEQVPLTPEQRAILREFLATMDSLGELAASQTGPVTASAKLNSMALHPSRAAHGGPRLPLANPPGMELAPGARVYTEKGWAVFVCPRGHRNVREP